jgi:hypothetical protein
MSNHMDRHGHHCSSLIRYSERFDEYAIPDYVAHDFKDAPVQLIKYCPWCGEELPKSKRDEWHDKLEAMGINPMIDEIPDDFKGEEWRREL